MNVLHPDNKITYEEGARVDVALGGDIKQIVHGTIVGLANGQILDWWIVRLDEMLSSWPYSCISVQHTFIRPEGDNRPFLCEGVSRAVA